MYAVYVSEILPYDIYRDVYDVSPVEIDAFERVRRWVGSIDDDVCLYKVLTTCGPNHWCFTSMEYISAL